MYFETNQWMGATPLILANEWKLPKKIQSRDKFGNSRSPHLLMQTSSGIVEDLSSSSMQSSSGTVEDLSMASPSSAWTSYVPVTPMSGEHSSASALATRQGIKWTCG